VKVNFVWSLSDHHQLRELEYHFCNSVLPVHDNGNSTQRDGLVAVYRYSIS